MRMIRPVVRHALALALAAAALVAPARAVEQRVEVEGVAPLGSDPLRARRAAIGDALRQALAAGGMDLEARTFIDRGIVQSDSLWATAKAKVTGYRLNDEWQEAGMVRVNITATLAPVEVQACSADPLPRLHLGASRLAVDPALDPAVVGPVLLQFDLAMRKAFSEDPSDRFIGPAAQPMALTDRSSERYASLAFGNRPGSGIYVRPYLQLDRRTVSGFGLVKGVRVEAVAGLELIDAARGVVLGRVVQNNGWALASRYWEYLPADYRPAKRMAAPDMQAMFQRLIDDAGQFIRCRPVAVSITSMQGDDLVLGGGSESGLRVGDLLSVGAPTVSASNGPEWPLAEVIAVAGKTAQARLLGGANTAIGANVAVRLR